MKLNCLFCGNQMFLNHKIFFNYEGGVKCSCCGAMMEIEMGRRILQLAKTQNSLQPLLSPSTGQR